MRGGFRKPSLKGRVAARTSVKRIVRHSLGVKAPKGMGWVTNPKKAAYNRVYNRMTVDPLKTAGGRGSSGPLSGTTGCATCLVLVGLLFVGGCFSFINSIHNQPPPETIDQFIHKQEHEEQVVRDTPPTMRLTAKELGEAYSLTGGNPDAANVKYEGKVIVVTGKVFLGITAATPNVILNSSDNGLSIKCWFTENDKARIGALKEGQKVTIKGRCDGIGGVDVVLSDCVFYK